MNIYGHEVELTDLDGDEVVTDVIVLARLVRFNGDGDAHDTLRIRSSRQTAGIVQQGMLTVAAQIQASNWAYDEDDE